MAKKVELKGLRDLVAASCSIPSCWVIGLAEQTEEGYMATLASNKRFNISVHCVLAVLVGEEDIPAFKENFPKGLVRWNVRQSNKEDRVATRSTTATDDDLIDSDPCPLTRKALFKIFQEKIVSTGPANLPAATEALLDLCTENVFLFGDPVKLNVWGDLIRQTDAIGNGNAPRPLVALRIWSPVGISTKLTPFRAAMADIISYWVHSSLKIPFSLIYAHLKDHPAILRELPKRTELAFERVEGWSPEGQQTFGLVLQRGRVVTIDQMEKMEDPVDTPLTQLLSTCSVEAWNAAIEAHMTLRLLESLQHTKMEELGKVRAQLLPPHLPPTLLQPNMTTAADNNFVVSAVGPWSITSTGFLALELDGTNRAVLCHVAPLFWRSVASLHDADQAELLLREARGSANVPQLITSTQDNWPGLPIHSLEWCYEVIQDALGIVHFQHRECIASNPNPPELDTRLVEKLQLMLKTVYQMHCKIAPVPVQVPSQETPQPTTVPAQDQEPEVTEDVQSAKKGVEKFLDLEAKEVKAKKKKGSPTSGTGISPAKKKQAQKHTGQSTPKVQLW